MMKLLEVRPSEAQVLGHLAVDYNVQPGQHVKAALTPLTPIVGLGAGFFETDIVTMRVGRVRDGHAEWSVLEAGHLPVETLRRIRGFREVVK